MPLKTTPRRSLDPSSELPGVGATTLEKSRQSTEDDSRNQKPKLSSNHQHLHSHSSNTPHKDGWLNKYTSSASNFSNTAWSSPQSNQQHWRLVRVVLQDGSIRVYKPPSDLGVKAFDRDISAQSIQVPHFTPSSLPPTNSIESKKRSAETSQSSGSRLFYRESEPHPELEYNERGKIVGGSVESICHTILFGPSDSFAKTAVLLLPLLTDMVSAIELLTLYSISVSHTGSSNNTPSILFSSANPTLSTTSSTFNHKGSTTSLVLRMQLVIETIQENLPGMLLDNTIYSVFMQLVESLSYHDNVIAEDLKISVVKKQKYMTEMLSFATHQEPLIWGGLQPLVNENASERLHCILSRVNAPNSNSSSAISSILPSHNYTSVNSSAPITMAVTELPGAIPPDLILEFGVDTLAKQIYHFHLAFAKDWSPTTDFALLFNTKYNYNRHSPLVFDAANLHFLGALLIDHLLNTVHRINNTYRGKILTYWINLGNALKNCGDMVGWLAIATVICSVPVLRLRGSWCYVATEIRDRVIREWAPVVFDLERRLMISDMSRKSTYHVLAPQGIGQTYPKERVVPFFGDLCVKFEEGSTFKQCESRLNSITTAFERWDSYLDQIPQNETFEPLPEPISVIQKMLYALLENHFDAPVMSPDITLQMSLEVEPSVSSAYLKQHYSPRHALSSGAFLPLLFTNYGPAFSLFSQQSLLYLSTPTSNPKKSLRASSSRSRDSFRSFSTQSTIGNTLSSVDTCLSSSSTGSAGQTLWDSYLTFTGYTELDAAARTFVDKYVKESFALRAMHDLLNVNVRLYHICDDIILKTCDDISSCPNSLVEGTDQVSDKNNNFVIKAATLDRLIDVLVLGIDDLSMFFNPNEKSLNEPFYFDMDLHTLSFFATFRSFCSPQYLLDSMTKRFMGARSAACSISELHGKISSGCRDFPTDTNFPNWNADCEEDPARLDWRSIAQIQIGVLEACHLWVQQYFSDFANDLSLRDQFLELLKSFELELQSWKESGALLNPSYQIYYDTIESLHKKVRKLYIKKSYRPIDVKRLVPRFAVATRAESLPLNGNILTLETLLDKVDLVAAEYFQMISMKDWMELFEILEVQSISSTGFFNFKPIGSSSEDELIIQDVYSYFEHLLCDGSEQRLLLTFPRPVRELFRLHSTLVNYFTFQICEPHIRMQERVGRMTSILKLLGINRTRMQNLDFVRNDVERSESDKRTNVPGFIESAICAALLKPESRNFTTSWTVSSCEINKLFGSFSPGQLNTIYEAIPNVLPSLLKQNSTSLALTPCVGWVMERMLEVINWIPDMSLDNPHLINFDKRRFVYSFVCQLSDIKQHINGIDSLYARGMDRTAVYSYTKGISHMINPVKGLYNFDRRFSRDAASRETKEYSKTPLKAKVFTSYIRAELEKIKRDQRQREVNDKTAKEQKKAGTRSRQPSNISSTAGTVIGERKTGRSRLGGLLKAVRPISMAFSSGFTPPADKIVHPNDLPDVSSFSNARYKFVGSIDLANASVIPLRGNHEQTIFKISSDGNQDLILQASNKAAADEWIHTTALAQKQAMMLAVTSPTSTKVFGVSVGIVCEREGEPLPYVVSTLLKEIEARGLDEVGLYRIPGSLASVNSLKSAFDSGCDVNMGDDRWFDINTVTGCFKLYLRELPEPLLTSELIGEFIVCGNMGNTRDGVLLLRRCIHRLPTFNYNLLKRLIDHLVLVAQHGKANLMHAVNLAIVFSMSFLPPQSSVSSVSSDLGAMQTMLKTMILSRDDLFTEVQQDDSDGPLPSQLPILQTGIHHLGLPPGGEDEALQLPQTHHLLIDPELSASISSLNVTSGQTAEIVTPVDTVLDNGEYPPQQTATQAHLNSAIDIGIPHTTPSSNPRSNSGPRTSNKRFSSLILPSALEGINIPGSVPESPAVGEFPGVQGEVEDSIDNGQSHSLSHLSKESTAKDVNSAPEEEPQLG